MIPPPAQRNMSKRAGSTVTEVAGSHAVYVSQPKPVAAFIEGRQRSGGEVKVAFSFVAAVRRRHAQRAASSSR